MNDDTRLTETTENQGGFDEVVQERGGRHPVSIGHLVMGVAFLGLVAIWAVFESGAVEGADLRWLLPVPWLAAGLGGLLAVALSGRRAAER